MFWQCVNQTHNMLLATCERTLTVWHQLETNAGRGSNNDMTVTLSCQLICHTQAHQCHMPCHSATSCDSNMQSTESLWSWADWTAVRSTSPSPHHTSSSSSSSSLSKLISWKWTLIIWIIPITTAKLLTKCWVMLVVLGMIQTVNIIIVVIVVVVVTHA